ncbi:hypothetical protein B0T09DRAFT_406555 [Sordaria sp. MPI-SDFR-AT-0083]|nr:hypothetical protein B0T09DRAFT_406555 [Sordaria sp. MPI-SDFR-AT-0083]
MAGEKCFRAVFSVSTPGALPPYQQPLPCPVLLLLLPPPPPPTALSPPPPSSPATPTCPWRPKPPLPSSPPNTASPCHHGPGPCHATYTITEECTGDRDSWAQPTGVVPPGFVVTTVTNCNACPGGPTQTFTVPANGPTGVVPAPGPSGPQPTMTSVVVTVSSQTQTGGQMPIQTVGAPSAKGTMSLKTSVGLLVGAALALFNFA